MDRRPDPDDDDFDDIYKEYTGPPVLTGTSVPEKAKPIKRSQPSSEEDEEPRDPNAVPTDFTSREAKVWEAKSKATERNWKKRKEEEMICKLCGESGHFTQGCPSTLGANRKSQDFFERVAARDKHVKALFSEKVIQKIEKDNGCKIKMEEKFIIVSGKDRLVLSKGVDAVHRVIKGEGSRNDSSVSHMSRSKSPERIPSRPRYERSESQKSFPSGERSQSHHRFGRHEKIVEERSFSSPQRSRSQQRLGTHDKIVEDRVREDLKNLSRGSSQAYDGGARGRSASLSKSPARLPYTMDNPYSSYDDGHGQSIGGLHRSGKAEREGPDTRSAPTKPHDYAALPTSLEELEMEYKKEAMELSRSRDKEEDEENYKHREAVREIRENYMRKLAILRGMHAKQWEQFLHHDVQRLNRENQQLTNPGFGGGFVKQPIYPDYDNNSIITSSTDAQYGGGNVPMNSSSRGRSQQSVENYSSSRPRDSYVEAQRQSRDDYGKTYNRY